MQNTRKHFQWVGTPPHPPKGSVGRGNEQGRRKEVPARRAPRGLMGNVVQSQGGRRPKLSETFRFFPGLRPARPQRPLSHGHQSSRQTPEPLTCRLLGSRCHCGCAPRIPRCASSSVPADSPQGAGRWRRRTKPLQCCVAIGSAPRCRLGDVVSRRKGRSQDVSRGLEVFWSGQEQSVRGGRRVTGRRVYCSVGGGCMGGWRVCVCLKVCAWDLQSARDCLSAVSV